MYIAKVRKAVEVEVEGTARARGGRARLRALTAISNNTSTKIAACDRLSNPGSLHFGQYLTEVNLITSLS